MKHHSSLQTTSGISGGSSSKLHNSQASCPPKPHTPHPAINNFNTCHAPLPPANIASPSFGSDVAATKYRATLRAAVDHIPLAALKMSTVLTASLLAPGPLAAAQGISNQRRQLKHTSRLASILPPPPHAPSPAINNFNTCCAPTPPAKGARPSIGSDVTAKYVRAMLRAAVVHIPRVALKMSTAST